MTYQLPPHLHHESVFTVDSQMLDERNWKRLPAGTLIRSFDQFFLLMPPAGWAMSNFVAADGQRVTGRTVYRRPRSLRAWLTVALPAARKVVSRFFTRQS
jgi:hypothetical protein